MNTWLKQVIKGFLVLGSKIKDMGAHLNIKTD